MEFFFEQNAELEEADFATKVPVEYQPFYAKGQDGKFRVAEAFATTVKNIDGLRTNYKTAQTNLTRANQESAERRIALEAFTGTAGVANADEFKAKWAELQTMVTEGKKFNPDTIRQELQTQFDAKVAPIQQERDGMEASLKEYLLDGEALRSIAEHKGNATLLLPHVLRQAAVIKDPNTGKYRAVAVNDRGEPLPDTDGGYLGVGKLVERLKGNKEYAPCFAGTTQTGGGLPPANNGGGPRVTPVVQPGGTGAAEKSPMSKIAAGLAARKQGAAA